MLASARLQFVSLRAKRAVDRRNCSIHRDIVRSGRRERLTAPVGGYPVSESSRQYFEDIQVGDEYLSPGRTVTEADIVAFAGLSGDYNVLHTDAEYMKSSIFGERIAHGLLGLAISSGLGARAVPRAFATIAFLGLRWRFKGPIKIGDTIKVRLKIASKRETSKPDRGIVTVQRHVVNQRGEVVQEGDTELMIERRK
jgi:acyl dehydratase